jgi:prevent-host-death family protein
VAEIGIRELKTRASEIIRTVRDQRARYLITYRGRPVGVLLPLEELEPDELAPEIASGTGVWEELVELGEEIGRGWQSPLTSAELLSGMRR